MLDGSFSPCADLTGPTGAPSAPSRPPSPWQHCRVADISVAPRPKPPGLHSRNFGDFLAHSYPPVEHVMAPWLPVRGLAMVAGYRGIGKTFVASSVAYAIATGGTLLGFRAPKPREVLYVDGEMDPAELQGRFEAIHAVAKRGSNGNPSLAAENLRILTHADQDLGIPDLSDPGGRGRELVERELGDAEVLVLDNLSCLCRTGVENDAESWAVMQEWLLSLRRAGKTVLLVHHTGKPDKDGNVSQRGTSKREDILNTSILLKPAAGGRKGEFVLQFTKSRGFSTPDPFTVRLRLEDGECALERRRVDLSADIAKLLEEGVSQKEIAKRLGVSPATVSRRKPKVSLRAKQTRTVGQLADE
jgi:DNA-directed RNA polymerase specialized sigma24 family protein